jgi:tetratricopeptide (TPR) repeat protein
MPRSSALIAGLPKARWLAPGIVALLATATLLQIWRDTAFPRNVAEESVLYVQSGEVARRLALSHDALLADVYWIRAIQHYGGTRRAAEATRRYELLQPLLSLTVSLDPLFNIAYRFGAIFLAEPPPGGPGRPDQAIALLERGLAARPRNWRYMQDIGFVYYWWVHDFRLAAAWFERAAAQPNAPWWLRSLAATTLAQGGDREASRMLWRALAESDNEWLRKDAARRLQQLAALDEVDRLQRIVRSAIARGLQKPYTWDAVRRAGNLRGLPFDPSGMPYDLGPWSGDVSVAMDSPLQPLPSEPPHGAAR